MTSARYSRRWRGTAPGFATAHQGHSSRMRRRAITKLIWVGGAPASSAFGPSRAARGCTPGRCPRAPERFRPGGGCGLPPGGRASLPSPRRCRGLPSGRDRRALPRAMGDRARLRPDPRIDEAREHPPSDPRIMILWIRPGRRARKAHSSPSVGRQPIGIGSRNGPAPRRPGRGACRPSGGRPGGPPGLAPRSGGARTSRRTARRPGGGAPAPRRARPTRGGCG